MIISEKIIFVQKNFRALLVYFLHQEKKMIAIKQFLSDPNDAPEYGYQDNAITGIGFWMMAGARFAISIYSRAENANNAFDRIVLTASAIGMGLITLPFTLLGAAMKAGGSLCPTRVENLTSDDIPCTDKNKVDQIYELLSIVNDALRQNGIEYSMDGGTLLGAIREKGVIKCDDDGDIMIMYKDKQRLLALKDALHAKGVVMQDSGGETFKLTFHADESANVDIFLMEEDSDGLIRPKGDYYKHLFPKEYFLKEELQQLRDYPFGPPEKQLFLRGPAHPMRFLKTFYGPECFEYMIRTHSHIQLGPFAFPILNFSKTRYKIVNPMYAEGHIWKRSHP